jgi:hypothetical protein
MDMPVKQIADEVGSENVSESVPPTMSGKQPSAYTALRHRLGAQTNCDQDYARQDFHALVSKAVNRSAVTLGPRAK